MSYPARPVLVGKAVRCKGCKNGFVLQADGVATKIQEPPPTQVTVSQVSQAATPAPPPNQPATAGPAPATPPRPPLRESGSAVSAAKKLAQAEQIVVVEPKRAEDLVTVLPAKPPTAPAPEPPKSERLAKRKTEQLEAARAQMAAQLAEIQKQAAESESAKREERKSERIAKTSRSSAVPGSAGGEVRPTSHTAILTGEGERYHRERRLWWVWVGAAAAVTLLLVFVFNLSSSTRETLQRYAAPAEADQNRYPLLGDVLRARAWLAAAKSMSSGPLLATDLADASFGVERTIAFEPLSAQLAQLKGLRLDDELGLWLAPADVEKARALASGRSGAEAAKALAPTKLRHVVHSQVVQKLGLPDEDVLVLVDLLTGTPPRDGEPIARRILDLGELPDRVVVRPFRGRRGGMLVDLGRPPYKPVQGPYAGTIMRFEGAKWPIGWRVLHLDLVK